jgi:hypothetical protein
MGGRRDPEKRLLSIAFIVSGGTIAERVTGLGALFTSIQYIHAAEMHVHMQTVSVRLYHTKKAILVSSAGFAGLES